MKTPLHLICVLAVVAAGLWFCWPAPKYAAQVRGQGVKETVAGAEPMIALVIGNSGYAEGPLANPVNDARDMTATLHQLGFEVLSGEDRNRRQMVDLINEFGRKIRGGGVGMFYFAGHGMQVGGYNYLIPVGATINSEAEVSIEALGLEFVLDRMREARNRLNIVVLDACRNNPFARSFRSSSRGLAIIDAPVGTLIAYATAPGRTASDGSGRNGLYTKELLAAMRVPGLKIEDVFKQVRSEVRRQSNDQQISWEASSIEGDFYFSTPGVRPTSTVSTPAPTVSTVAPGLAEMLRQAEDSCRRHDYDGMIRAAQKALIADPNSGVAHRFLYEAYLFQHNSDRSNQARDNAVRLLEAPKNAMEYEARGVIYQLTDRRRAIADFNEAIRLDPNYALAYNNRGATYVDFGEHDQVIADLSKAIRLDPRYVEAYFNRGVAYGQKREYDLAIADHNEAIRLDPKFALAYNERGMAFGYKGEYGRSIADYSEAIRLDPRFAMVYRNRGYIYLLIKDYDRAIADFSEAIRLDPRFAVAYNERGAAYLHKGEYALSIADHNEAIRLDPRFAVGYYNRGYAYFSMRDYARAIADCSEAIRLDPRFASAYQCRALAYRMIGRFDLAEADERTAMGLSGK